MSLAEQKSTRIACRICGNAENNAVHHAQEMMFGTRDTFDYIECGGCGCLQIAEIPPDLSKYYPDNYYSFRPKACVREGRAARAFRRARTDYALTGAGILGRCAAALTGVPYYLEWFRTAGLGREARVLDVGCGAGDLLLELAKQGFTRLEGADPFIEGDIAYPNGVRIHKQTLDVMAGEYDLVMMNHSIEHMPDQPSVFADLSRLVRPGGWALVRTPVAGCYAWRTYGVHWVALDAPRHLFIHTPKSIAMLAEDAGFALEHTIYDSNVLQFTASEMIRRDIPWKSSGRSHEFISPEQRAEFRRKTVELNAAGDGDAACFFFRRRS